MQPHSRIWYSDGEPHPLPHHVSISVSVSGSQPRLCKSLATAESETSSEVRLIYVNVFKTLFIFFSCINSCSREINNKHEYELKNFLRQTQE